MCNLSMNSLLSESVKNHFDYTVDPQSFAKFKVFSHYYNKKFTLLPFQILPNKNTFFSLFLRSLMDRKPAKKNLTHNNVALHFSQCFAEAGLSWTVTYILSKSDFWLNYEVLSQNFKINDEILIRKAKKFRKELKSLKLFKIHLDGFFDSRRVIIYSLSTLMESLLQQTHKIMMKPTRINKAKYALEIVMKYFSENVNTSKKSTVNIRPFAHSPIRSFAHFVYKYHKV